MRNQLKVDSRAMIPIRIARFDRPTFAPFERRSQLDGTNAFWRYSVHRQRRNRMVPQHDRLKQVEDDSGGNPTSASIFSRLLTHPSCLLGDHLLQPLNGLGDI